MQALIASYKPSRCVRLLLQLLPEDDWPVLGNTVTCSQDTDLASARKSPSGTPVATTKTESSPEPTYQTASANLIRSCCEVHGCIFSVLTSGVICVLKLCYALRHIRMTVVHMHLLHVGLGTHAHATAPCTFDNCTRSGSPHNVLHSSSNNAHVIIKSVLGGGVPDIPQISSHAPLLVEVRGASGHPYSTQYRMVC